MQSSQDSKRYSNGKESILEDRDIKFDSQYASKRPLDLITAFSVDSCYSGSILAVEESRWSEIFQLTLDKNWRKVKRPSHCNFGSDSLAGVQVLVLLISATTTPLPQEIALCASK